jgi:pyruvate/2-oxoglutarate dehydrogenase complex dihydrolipoamide acyltransferase (E2) component
VAKILVSAGSKDVAVGTPICVVCEEGGDVGAFASYVPTAGAEMAGTLPTTPDAPAAAAPAKAAAPAAAPAAKQASDIHPPLFLPSLLSSLASLDPCPCLSVTQSTRANAPALLRERRIRREASCSPRSCARSTTVPTRDCV